MKIVKEEKEPSVIELGEKNEQDFQNEEQIKEVVSNATAEELLEAYLKDPQVIENINSTANYFNTLFRGNWFTIEQVKKKTVYKSDNEDELQHLFQTLILAHKCIVKIEKGVYKYKISLTLQDKVNHLQNQIDIKKGELVILEMEQKRVLDKMKSEINVIKN